MFIDWRIPFFFLSQFSSNPSRIFIKVAMSKQNKWIQCIFFVCASSQILLLGFIEKLKTWSGSIMPSFFLLLLFSTDKNTRAEKKNDTQQESWMSRLIDLANWYCLDMKLCIIFFFSDLLFIFFFLLSVTELVCGECLLLSYHQNVWNFFLPYMSFFRCERFSYTYVHRYILLNNISAYITSHQNQMQQHVAFVACYLKRAQYFNEFIKKKTEWIHISCI